MGFLDALLGRTKPVKPDLDQLFGLPSAAITLEAAADFRPTGVGSVCFSAVEGGAFAQVQQDVQALLDADTGQGGAGDGGHSPIESSQDSYGFTWLTARQGPDDIVSLVNDLHAINSALESTGFGPQLLCSLVNFIDSRHRRLALVYTYKRGKFYPFAPVQDQKRDNPLEIQISSVLKNDLAVEPDLTRWFPIWGAPGL
jgi:hypothetical protein